MSDRERFREHRVRTSWPTVPKSSGDSEMREKARELWRHFGIVVLWPDQSIPWDMRAMAENAARKLYGERVKDGRG